MPDEATVMPAEGAKAATFLNLTNNKNSTNQNFPIIDNKNIHSSYSFQSQLQQDEDLLLPPISTMLLANNVNQKTLLPPNHNFYNQHNFHSQILHNANTAKISAETTKISDNAAVDIINYKDKNYDDNINNKNVIRQSKTVWKIFSASGGRVLRLIKTNSKKANWMKNVRLATTKETQNLVACQVFAILFLKQ